MHFRTFAMKKNRMHNQTTIKNNNQIRIKYHILDPVSCY